MNCNLIWLSAFTIGVGNTASDAMPAASVSLSKSDTTLEMILPDEGGYSREPYVPSGPRPLSVAGNCFLVLALTHFIINSMLYIIREQNKLRPQLQSALSAAHEEASRLAKDASQRLHLDPAHQVGELVRVVNNSKYAGEEATVLSFNYDDQVYQVQVTGGPKITVVESQLSLITLEQARAPQAASGATDKLVDLGGEVFNEQNVSVASAALTFVGPLSIIMLFILFRAIEQGVEVPTSIETFFYLAVAGILVQACSVVVQIDMTSAGNVSAWLGSLLTYVGYAGMVYGLFTVRATNGVPLSAAATGIIFLSVLLFSLNVVIKFVEFSAYLPQNIMGPLFRTEALQRAVTLCENIPFMCSIMFYLHFRMRFTGNLMPDAAEQSIYSCVVGLYCQALGQLVGSCHQSIGDIADTVGLILTTLGFTVMLYFGITAATIQSVLIECYLELMVVVVFCLVVSKLLERYLTQYPMYLQTLQGVLGTTKYAAVLSVLLLYCHFRSRVTGDPISVYTTMSARAAVYSILVQVAVEVAGGLSAQRGQWVRPVLFLSMLGLHVGFGGLVYSAFHIGVPLTELQDGFTQVQQLAAGAISHGVIASSEDKGLDSAIQAVLMGA